MANDTERWTSLDKQYCWHPFTPQKDWCADDHEILMLVGGQGVWLEDSYGNRYIDGNSSIWTNIHGHRHPAIVQAMKDQLDRVAHTSYLGYAHPLAGELAQRLCSFFPENTLTRVFFSDDGSTALECALKIERQYRMQTGQPERTRFIAFENCYHGDTMGAASLGGVSTFFERFRDSGMPVTHIGNMAELAALPREIIDSTAAVVIEPIIQGVNRMNVWPEGMLKELRQWTEQHGIHLILDEVMTGYGRTGHMFACLKENVTPDFLCSAKGLTGGYTPMAATLIRESIYEAFLNTQPGKDNTFYYGHSFTAHQGGCAAALASLNVFRDEKVLESLPPKINLINRLAHECRAGNPHIGAIRQAGMVMGIDLVQENGHTYPNGNLMAKNACLAMKKYGLLTRPVLDTVVFMPPLCISEEEIRLSFEAINRGILDACQKKIENV